MAKQIVSYIDRFGMKLHMEEICLLVDEVIAEIRSMVIAGETESWFFVRRHKTYRIEIKQVGGLVARFEWCVSSVGVANGVDGEAKRIA